MDNVNINLDIFNFSRHEVIRYAPYLTNISRELLDKFQIFCDSNFHIIDDDNVLQENKIRICWVHSSPEQNEEILNSLEVNPKPLANGGWNKFHKIIFVSQYQMENWVKLYDIPRSHCSVIKHAINPIEYREKPKDKIVLIYHSNPQRGLSILVDVFEELCEEYDNIELKVHSCLNSYKNLNHIHSVKNAQSEYEKSDLYKRLEKHPRIHNVGYVSDEDLRKSLASSHIFAYPNIFVENFCMSLLESMSAGILCVHPNYGALPETSCNWTMIYPYHEKKLFHQKIFYQQLKNAIKIINHDCTKEHLKKQKEYVDYFFNIDKITKEWSELLKNLENQPHKKIRKSFTCEY